MMNWKSRQCKCVMYAVTSLISPFATLVAIDTVFYFYVILK